MKCPACPTVSLVMTDRSRIEIDYCPDCRGVWLDRGGTRQDHRTSNPHRAGLPTCAPHRALPGRHIGRGRSSSATRP
jgi:Zn-finger nucleic acid-binding protein